MRKNSWLSGGTTGLRELCQLGRQFDLAAGHVTVVLDVIRKPAKHRGVPLVGVARMSLSEGSEGLIVPGAEVHRVSHALNPSSGVSECGVLVSESALIRTFGSKVLVDVPLAALGREVLLLLAARLE